MTASHRSLLSAALCIAILTGALGGDEGEPAFSQESANKNHPAELPRFPLKDAVESHKTIASGRASVSNWRPPSRSCRSPVAIDFDEDGRLYVAEFPEYNQYANPKYTEGPYSPAGRHRWRQCVRQEHAFCRPSSDGHGRCLLGRRRLRRLGARSALPQGHKRRRQGRRAPGCLHRASAATRRARGC